MSMSQDERTPPIAEVWQRYTTWLRDHMPVAYANLAPGATPEQLAEVAAVTGHDLPADARALLSLNNGQRQTTLATVGDVPDSAVAAFPDTNLLSTDCIVTEWRSWRETAESLAASAGRDDADLGCSLDPGQVKPLYANRHWIPLFTAALRGDHFGLDFDPGPAGASGQVINFGRDEERHYVAAPDLTTMLRQVTEAVMALGPAEPAPPAWPAVCRCSDDVEEDEECDEDRAYWDGYRHAFELVHHHRFPKGSPKPQALEWADWPARERSS